MPTDLRVKVRNGLFPPRVDSKNVRGFIRVVQRCFKEGPCNGAFRALHRRRERLSKGHRQLLIPPIMKGLPRDHFQVRSHFRHGLKRTHLCVAQDHDAIANRSVAPISLTISRRIFLSRLCRYVASKDVTVQVRLRNVSSGIHRLIMTSIIRPLR